MKEKEGRKEEKGEQISQSEGYRRLQMSPTEEQKKWERKNIGVSQERWKRKIEIL
jgi:hypothetical protein